MRSSIEDMKKIPGNDIHVCLQIHDTFVRIKRQVAEHVIVWNDRIHDFEVQLKKTAITTDSRTTRSTVMLSNVVKVTLYIT